MRIGLFYLNASLDVTGHYVEFVLRRLTVARASKSRTQLTNIKHPACQAQVMRKHQYPEDRRRFVDVEEVRSLVQFLCFNIVHHQRIVASLLFELFYFFEEPSWSIIINNGCKMNQR